MIMNIHPMDVLLFRDARPFNIEQGIACSTTPMPSTIAGAIRSKILIHSGMSNESKKFISYENPDDAEKIDIAGVFFSCRDDEVFPTPFDVVKVKKSDNHDSEIAMVAPMEILGHKYLGGDYLHFKPIDNRYISSQDLMNYLEGTLTRIGAEVSPYQDEDRVGIKIDPTEGTAEEGKLYRVSFLRFDKGVFLSVWLGKDEIKNYIPEKGILKLGGESRGAYYELKDENRKLFGRRLPPNILEKINDAKRFRVYLATPYVFRSDFEEELRRDMENRLSIDLVVKGSAPEITTLSGWDYKKNRQKEGRKVLKEGSVMYFIIESGKLTDIEYPLNIGLMRTLGFGCIFIGAW